MSKEKTEPKAEAEQKTAQAEPEAKVKQPEAEQKAEETDWQAKCVELNDAHLRLMADFDNFRKRNIKEKADLIRNAGESILTELLPIVDNFERALESMQKADDVKAVSEGVELIYTQLMNMLKGQGVTVIETKELPLDTDLHDAITTIPAPTPELKGKIVDCVKKGYKLNDKVIRHAQVVVGE